MKPPLLGSLVILATATMVGAAGGLLTAFGVTDDWLTVFLGSGIVTALACVFASRLTSARVKWAPEYGDPAVAWTTLAMPVAWTTLTQVTEAGFACQSSETWPILSILSLAYIPLGSVIVGWLAGGLRREPKPSSGHPRSPG
jgi:hypothetical protein